MLRENQGEKPVPIKQGKCHEALSTREKAFLKRLFSYYSLPLCLVLQDQNSTAWTIFYLAVQNPPI